MKIDKLCQNIIFLFLFYEKSCTQSPEEKIDETVFQQNGKISYAAITIIGLDHGYIKFKRLKL